MQWAEAVVPLPAVAVSVELQELQKKILSYLAGAVADCTADRYIGSFKRFSKFCETNNVPCLPSYLIIIMSFLIKIREEANSAAPTLAARSEDITICCIDLICQVQLMQ